MEAADKTDKKLIFAADLGGTHLRAAVVDHHGHIQSRFKQNTPQVADAYAIVDAIVSAVKELQKGAEISAVSLVVPGTVNVEEGSVVTAPNLPCLLQLATAWNSPARPAPLAVRLHASSPDPASGCVGLPACALFPGLGRRGRGPRWC